METSKTNLNSTSKRLQTRDMFGELHWVDCIYGQPTQDDYINKCDCYDDPVEAKLLNSINEIWR